MLFLKPTSSYLENGGTIEIPYNVDSVHHEVELAVVIGKKARDVPESSAMDYVGGNVSKTNSRDNGCNEYYNQYRIYWHLVASDSQICIENS